MVLSVVFSFRNEEPGLKELIGRVQRVMRSMGMDYEILFVNDDSTDRSLEILMEQREADRRIRIINMSRRFGVSPCVIAGLKHSRGDAVVYMDTDLQDPPEIIPLLVEKWRAGADVVNTVRTKRLGENPFRMWLTRRAYNIINSISEIDLPENMGDFKLLSRRVVDEVVGLNEHDPFMRGLVRWVGFRQETVFYTREARYSGETHFSLFGGGPVREFIRGLTSYSSAPLFIALGSGLIVSLISFVSILTALVRLFMGLRVPGWAVVLMATLFLGGLILLTNGFLGLYVGRMYTQVKNRPLFIIRDKIGFD